MRDPGTSVSDSGGMYDDQVIDAAYLHSCPNCYFIGPFAKRVSFASQQYRAIDLVAALHRKGKLTPDKTVAVIGAGLAGLMITAALLGTRCKNVHLYEMKEPMHRQTAALHRVVHPTISRWPMEPLSLTTNFPFLDWFAAPCDKIVKCLLADWKENLVPQAVADGFQLRQTEVTYFSFPSGLNEGRVRLETDPKFDDLYDLVFVTTGFADEHTIGKFKATSYWIQDDIARRTPEDLEEWRQGKKPIVVSGCGDGGLIDCLRIIHGHFRDGWLAIELAEMLGPAFDGKESIATAEHEALMAARSIACMPSRPASFKEEAFRSAKYISTLAKAYYDVVGRLPQEALKLLDDSIAAAKISASTVRLIAKEPEPFVPYSAPIHKLMIAHALQKGHVTYKSAQVHYKKRTAHLTMPDGTTDTVPKALLVVRHGAPANMIKPIGLEELASLKIRQLLMADYIDRDAKREISPPTNYPHRTESPERFIASRYRLAKALVEQIAPHVRLSADHSGFRYVSIGKRPEPSDISTRPQLHLPQTLFGINARSWDLAHDTDLSLL